MLDFIKTKKTYMLLLAVLFVFISLSDTTYSLFLNSNEVAELNYNTGLLDLKFMEDEQIVLEKSLPIKDSDAVNLEPYVLKIQNIGTLPYLFDLSLIATNQDDVIDSRYIKVKVNDSLPNNLFVLGNKISMDNIIYPGEEKSFKISIWLDETTPNTELGKKFVAKVVTSGSAVYKTKDTSGVNYPNLRDDMIPVYYDEAIHSWRVADKTNTNDKNEWYNYDSQKWANVVILNSSSKKIYDIALDNDLNINNLKVNNGNLIIDDNYLNIGLSSFNENNVTNIFRVKFDDLTSDKIYLISNDSMSYYYDTKNKTFGFVNGTSTVISNSYIIDSNKWYLVGYTYDKEKVNFYVNGVKVGTSNVTGEINRNNSNFLIATDSSHKIISKLTIGDILIYNRVLKDNEIATNYKDSINIIRDGLFCGYNEFTPMTITEYYINSGVDTVIDYDDVNMHMVWIPRYKYRVWNILGNNENSYDAFTSGIDIVFENGNKTTGEVSCQNNACIVNGEFVTISDNGKYYTHPAFGDNLTGFWVSKYELSTDSKDCNDNNKAGCAVSTLPIQSKEGNTVWRNNYLTNYYKAVDGTNYNIIKNTEWGAITYLAHSKYGVCSNNTCKEINGSTSYVSGSNLNDTTTGNNYGVFDMAGGATEYMLSGYKTKSGFNNFELYTAETFILGDATKEIVNNNKLWYDNTYNYLESSDKLIARGGDGNNYKGIFAITTVTDNISDNLSTRIILK